MLREGLRQELPEVFAIAARLRRLRFPRMPPLLAAIAALGAQWLSISLLRGLVSVAYLVLPLPRLRTAEITELLSWAVGALLAFTSAGRRGAATFAGLALTIEIEKILVGTPGTMVFCERTGRTDCAIEPVQLALSAWPVAAGLVLGLAARRSIQPGRIEPAALALGAGIVALSLPVVRLAIVPFVGLIPEGSSARAAYDWVIGAQVLAAFAMGAIAGRFGRRHLMDAALIGAAYILVWLPQLSSWIRDRPSTMPRFVLAADWQMFIPVLFALAALAGLIVGVASQWRGPRAIDLDDQRRRRSIGRRARTKRA